MNCDNNCDAYQTWSLPGMLLNLWLTHVLEAFLMWLKVFHSYYSLGMKRNWGDQLSASIDESKQCWHGSAYSALEITICVRQISALADHACQMGQIQCVIFQFKTDYLNLSN